MTADDEDFWVRGTAAGAPVRRYLFRRWSGYAHPVQLDSPLTKLELAVADHSYCRATVAGDGTSAQTMSVESMRRTATPEVMENAPPTMPNVPTFFELDDEGRVGREVSLDEATEPGRFLRVFRPDTAAIGTVERVINDPGLLYEYTYDGDGLRRVEITRYEPGKGLSTSALDY